MGGGDLQGQIGPCHQATPQHEILDATHRTAASPVVDAPDFAVGIHRQRHYFLNPRHPLPIGGRTVGVRLGACVHHQLRGAGRGQGAGAVQGLIAVLVAQAHLGGDRDRRRRRRAHRRDDAVQQFRLAQQHRAAPRAVDGLCRAAEVEVDHRRTKLAGAHRILGQPVRIRAQQLHAHLGAGAGARALVEFRRDAAEHRGRQQLFVDADELAHAPIDAADPGQHVAQDVVDQAFHRRQGDLHGSRGSQKGRAS